MIFQMLYWKLNLLLVFIPKHSIFWRRLKSLVALTTQPFCDKKIFLELLFQQNLYNWIYFGQITQKESSSCMISHDDGWFSSKVTVFAKDSILRKISYLKLFLVKECRANRQIFLMCCIPVNVLFKFNT